MDEFVKVGRTEDLRNRRANLIEIDGVQIALFCIEGVYYALAHLCPHQHLPTLANGELHDHTIQCPMHGWSFNLHDGTALNGEGKARVYAVRVESGDVYVEKPTENSGW